MLHGHGGFVKVHIPLLRALVLHEREYRVNCYSNLGDVAFEAVWHLLSQFDDDLAFGATTLHVVQSVIG
jgi:hypothetical protein